jgi:hypothetical protein
MKKIMKKFRITWITVWLVVIATAFSAFIGYATYTGVTSVKRVASTRAGAGILFSSNYMRSGSNSQTSLEYRDYSEFTDEHGNPLEANPEYNMVVCNYSQGDKATWYTANDINYSVTAKLLLSEKYTSEDIENGVDPSLLGEYKTPTSSDLGTLKFGIKYSGDADYTYFSSSQLTITLPATGNYTLNKAAASSDMFSLLFDKSELKNNAPKFWIKVTATPISVSGGEVENIAGYVGTCKSAEGGANWTGSIGDDNYSTIDYDSYNYIISGTGKGSFYFAWDDTKVKPNEFAFINYASDINTSETDVDSWTNYTQYGTTQPTSGTWRYIELEVDSEETARYEFQLYKTNGVNYSGNISKYVDFYFVAD